MTARRLAARVPLRLVIAADRALDALDLWRLRTKLARLVMRAAIRLAEAVAPWTRTDHRSTVGRWSSTWFLLRCYAKLKLSFWRLKLAKAAS